MRLACAKIMSFVQYVDFIGLLCDDCRKTCTRDDFTYLFWKRHQVDGQLQFYAVLSLTSVSATVLKRRQRLLGSTSGNGERSSQSVQNPDYSVIRRYLDRRDYDWRS
jgi:hypothetical protein